MGRLSNNDLTLQVGFDIDRFNKELAKTNTSLNKWASGVTSSLKGVAAGFSAIAIGRFVLDVSKLAGEAEGVSAAFNKLPDSVKLMQDLKAATGGTVSELELMKRSVMASNFDISLKALPQLLEFATLRARQTGQSVDYLVDSIVTGIGRKSKLILDNLGISAVQLTEALGGASAASSTIGEVAEAVGRIASKNLEKMGKLTDDAAVRADRLAASWKNMQVTMGQFSNNIGLSFMIEMMDEFLKRWNQVFTGKSANPMRELNLAMENFNKQQKMLGGDKNGFFADLAKLEDLAKQAGVQLIKLRDEATGVQKVLIKSNPVNFIDGTKIPEQVRNVKFLEETIASLNEEIKLSGSQSQIAKYQKEIILLQREIEKLLGKQKDLTFSIEQGPMPEVSTNKSDYNTFNDFEFPDFTIFKEELEAVNDEIDKSRESFDKWKEGFDMSVEMMATAAMRLGDEFGSLVGELIIGTETLAQAAGRMAVAVIREIKRIALARMAADSIKYGPGALFAAAAGFALIEMLFSRIGAGGGDASNSKVNRRVDPRTGSHVNFVIQGQNLVGVMDNYNRIKQRTG